MNPQNPYEPKLAWAIWQAVEKLNDLLWDRYENDFLSFTMEENDQEWLSTLSDTEQIDESSPGDTTSSET